MLELSQVKLIAVTKGLDFKYIDLERILILLNMSQATHLGNL
jgi:hypothetical protein